MSSMTAHVCQFKGIEFRYRAGLYVKSAVTVSTHGWHAEICLSVVYEVKGKILACWTWCYGGIGAYKSEISGMIKMFIRLRDVLEGSSKYF